MASASQADSRGFDSRLSLHRKRDTLRCPFFCGAREKRTTRDEKIGENSLRTRVSVRARAQPEALPRGPLQGFRQIPVSRFAFCKPHATKKSGRIVCAHACRIGIEGKTCALPRGPLQGFRQIPVSRFSFCEPHATKNRGEKFALPACRIGIEGKTCALPRGPLQGRGQSFSRPKNMPQAA